MLSEILALIVIPIYLLGIGVELLIQRLRTRQPLYRVNDTINSISTGVFQQLVGIFTKILVIGSYIWIVDNIAIQQLFGAPAIPNTWLWYVIAFFVFDFLYYWFHRHSHGVNIIWASHVVHHSSEEYNLSTALRQGSLQGLFSWPYYLVMAFLGFSIEMFLVVSALDLLWQYFLHTRSVGKLGFLEYFMNTPSHHRVHHGKNPQYIDRNHGGALIIWDKLFGTFEPEGEEVVYGITKPLNSWNPIWANLEAFADLAHDALHAKTLREKFLVWFKPPGWRPTNLPPYKAAKKIEATTYIKYDTLVPLGINAYCLIQFVIALGYSVWVLKSSENMPLLWTLGYVTIAILAITNLGGLLELQRWALYSELGKNCIGGILLFFALQTVAPLWVGAIVGLAYTILFNAWLRPFIAQYQPAKVQLAA